MNNDLTARFFTNNDEKQSRFEYDLPITWWSRPYEYCWASQFVEKEDVVLDSACGICHPFKFYLTDKCKKVYACDNDWRIKYYSEILKDIELSIGEKALAEFEFTKLEKISFSCCEIDMTPYMDKYFNKIFCISVLEHLHQDLIGRTLQEYHRILKDDGMVVLTMDYPNINPAKFIELVEEGGFVLAGDRNFDKVEDAISYDYFGTVLSCFRVVLKKRGK